MKVLHLFVLAAVIVSCLALVACGEQAATGTKTYGPTGTGTQTTAPTAPTTTTAAPGVIELSFSYSAPPIASLAVAIFEPWAKDLEAACGGRVKITIHAGGTLLEEADAYDGVVTGICDIAQLATNEYPGRFPLCGISDLPLVFPSTEVAGAAYHEWLLKHAADTELKDVKLLLTAPLWGQHYYGNTPLEKLEDFGGMKFRASGKTDAEMIMALGATPVEVETGDLFSALDTGLIGGTFFTWTGYFQFGLKDVTTYKTECAIASPIHLIVMNKKVYEGLPDDIKKIFDEFSGVEASKKWAAAHAALEVVQKAKVVDLDTKTHKPAIYVLPQVEKDRWAEAVQVVKDDWMASVPNGKALYGDLVSLIMKYK